MLTPRDRQRSFYDADSICERLIPEDSFYPKFREIVASLFDDSMFESMYCLDNGRPPIWKPLGSDLRFSGFDLFNDVTQVVWIHVEVLCYGVERVFMISVGRADDLVSGLFGQISIAKELLQGWLSESQLSVVDIFH